MTKQKACKGIISCLSFIVDLVVIFAVILTAGFGIYSIWDTQQIYAAADASIYETYRPRSDENNSLSFAELQSMNSDVIGWITVYGTGIDYPVVQGSDNNEYMNKTATGEFSLGGAIFIDRQNKRDFSDFNTIIYGHHMEESKMLGDIDKFDGETYFNEHQYGNLYYEGQNHGVEFFAMIDANAYDFVLYNSQVADADGYLSYLQSIARYWRSEAAPGTNNHIVMLSTCANSSTNGRHVLFGRITDETYDNAFVSETTVIQRTVEAVKTERVASVQYIAIALILAALLLVLIMILFRAIKVRKARQKRNEMRKRNIQRSR